MITAVKAMRWLTVVPNTFHLFIGGERNRDKIINSGDKETLVVENSSILMGGESIRSFYDTTEALKQRWCEQTLAIFTKILLRDVRYAGM